MADEKYLAILKQGVDAWNTWRKKNTEISRRFNLSGAYLSGANLSGANLSGAYLSGADLSGADLSGANLHGADLEADLREADLCRADLSQANLLAADLSQANLLGAKLFGADLRAANLRGANLRGANLHAANLSHAILIGANLHAANLSHTNLIEADLKGTRIEQAAIGNTILVNVDLSSFVNAQITHNRPSTIDHRSIARSLHCANLFPFLVATGMNHVVATYLIDSIRSLDPNGLFNLMHSTFISYGGPDEPFAIKLRETLQTNGVTTFLFKEDAVPGESLSHVMRAGIREHERVVLICSEASLNRSGVLNEIELTLRREASAGGATLLIPLAIDRYVFDDWNPNNDDLREAVLERVIADFEYADTDQSKFDQGIERLLQALKVSE